MRINEGWMFMDDNGISLKKVSKTINGKNIVFDISFEVKKGEIFGLLGPNGAGKTTTIKMITGLSKVTEGDILICNKDLKSSNRIVSHIGAIVENPTFYDYLSGYSNLKIYSRMFDGVSSSDIEVAVKKMGLEDRIKEKVKYYSLGMKQRLGIALAMVHNPDILILDEPTNGLDPSGTISMRNYLKELAHEYNVAILISSHLLNEMENICDKVGIMYKGKLLKVQNLTKSSDFNYKNTYKIETSNNKVANKLLSTYIDRIDQENKKIYINIYKQEVNGILNLLLSKNLKIYDFSLIKPNLEEYFIDLINNEKSEEI